MIRELSASLAIDPLIRVLLMFEFNAPYDATGLAPADIREDFAGLCFEHGRDPQALLDTLAVYLPADKLAEFMDDLAMGRV
jgi:hypothetical protein